MRFVTQALKKIADMCKNILLSTLSFTEMKNFSHVEIDMEINILTAPFELFSNIRFR